MKKLRKKRLVSFDAATDKALMQDAKKRGIPVSALIRIAVKKEVKLL